MRSLVLALGSLLAFAPRYARAEPPKLTLDQVIAKAIANPRVQMANGDRDAAAARVDEADAARLPRLKATAFGTISPEILSTRLRSLPPTEAATEIMRSLRRHWPLVEQPTPSARPTPGS